MTDAKPEGQEWMPAIKLSDSNVPIPAIQIEGGLVPVILNLTPLDIQYLFSEKSGDKGFVF